MEKPWLKSYAPGVGPTLEYEKITVSEALARTAGKYPEKTALIFLDVKITYKQLNDMVNSFANALIDMGVKPGDKVAMLMPNMPQIVIASYGAWRAGAVVVMNNPLYTDHELEHQLNNSESTVLVTLDLLGPRMIALKPKTPVKKIVVAHIRDHLKFPKNSSCPLLPRTSTGISRQRRTCLNGWTLSRNIPSRTRRFPSPLRASPRCSTPGAPPASARGSC